MTESKWVVRADPTNSLCDEEKRYFVVSERFVQSDMEGHCWSRHAIAWVYSKTSAYRIKKALNAYPRLIEALREIEKAATSIGTAYLARKKLSFKERERLFKPVNDARALLAELEETNK